MSSYNISHNILNELLNCYIHKDEHSAKNIYIHKKMANYLSPMTTKILHY